jgi:signal transduction histidine kinase
MNKPESDSRYIERFRILTQVSQRISSILAIDQLLVEIVQLVQQTFGFYHVGIGLVEGEDVVYRVGAGSLWEKTDFQFKPRRLKIGKQGITGMVAASGKPYLAPDVNQDTTYVWMQGSETKSELAVPILVKNQVIGVLDVQSQELDAFDPIDQELMTSLANQAGVAIENARLFSVEQRRVEQFRAISEVGRHIASILELDELLNQLAKSIQRTFNYYLVEIGLVEGEELVFRTRAGREGETQAKPFRIKVGKEGITGWVAATGKSYLAPDVNQEPKYVRITHHETRSELAVPIQFKGAVMGVLNIQSDSLNAFDESDVELMELLANQAGVAIQNARLYQQARQVAVWEERQRMARELHDSVTQSLYGISLYTQAALGQLAMGNKDQAVNQLGEIGETAQEALAEMRLLIFELRPQVLEQEGLMMALHTRLSSVEQRAGLKTSIKDTLSGRLPLAIEESLYRIALEALNNVIKHANAKSVQIVLNQEAGRLVMEIMDDGIGFDTTKTRRAGCIGLTVIQERADAIGGRLEVQSQVGSGTCIRVEVLYE